MHARLSHNTKMINKVATAISTIRELTDRRFSHDGAVGLRDITTAHACLGTCRRRAKVNDVGKSDLPAS